MYRSLLVALLLVAPLGAQSVTVPLILDGNAPIVELELSTASVTPRIARFLVDTGGGAFILGSRLMVDTGAVTRSGVDAGAGAEMVELEPLEARLGGMVLDLSRARIVGKPGSPWLGPRNQAEGMLPASVLRRYDVVFDYPAGLFTLAKPREEPGADPGRGIEVATPIGEGSGFPRIEVEIFGGQHGFLLDTGASFTMISRTQLDEIVAEEPTWAHAIGATGYANMFGGEMENGALMLRFPSIAIGGIEVTEVAVVSRPPGTFEEWMSERMSAPIVGALGGNVLRDFRIAIDYRRGVTRIERGATLLDADSTAVGLVLAAAPGDGQLVVTGISTAASSGVREGVRPGDTLLAIDETPVTGASLATAARLLSGEAGASKRLHLRRDGAERIVTVPVRKLY